MVPVFRDFSVNVVQAMDRALLVDVVPPAEQASANAWAARMFGFGAVFGYGLGTLDLVRWTGGIFGDEQIKVGCVLSLRRSTKVNLTYPYRETRS